VDLFNIGTEILACVALHRVGMLLPRHVLIDVRAHSTTVEADASHVRRISTGIHRYGPAETNALHQLRTTHHTTDVCSVLHINFITGFPAFVKHIRDGMGQYVKMFAQKGSIILRTAVLLVSRTNTLIRTQWPVKMLAGLEMCTYPILDVTPAQVISTLMVLSASANLTRCGMDQVAKKFARSAIIILQVDVSLVVPTKNGIQEALPAKIFVLLAIHT
jgi:hypothetical protein